MTPLRNTLVLISCGAEKLDRSAQAQDLYIGQLFKLQLAVARMWASDLDIRILSAKHGVLPLDRKVAPYDMTLTKMSAARRRFWSVGIQHSIVYLQVRRRFDRIVGLLPAAYARWKVPIPLVLPLEGLGIGDRKSLLRKALGQGWLPDELAKHAKRLRAIRIWDRARKG